MALTSTPTGKPRDQTPAATAGETNKIGFAKAKPMKTLVRHGTNQYSHGETPGSNPSCYSWGNKQNWFAMAKLLPLNIEGHTRVSASLRKPEHQYLVRHGVTSTPRHIGPHWIASANQCTN